MGPGDAMRAFIAIDLVPEIKAVLREFVRALRATRADVRGFAVCAVSQPAEPHQTPNMIRNNRSKRG